MNDIHAIQRELCISDKRCLCKNEGRRPDAIVVIWVGWEATHIREVAATLGKEPREFVRWAVDGIAREATFSTAIERFSTDCMDRPSTEGRHGDSSGEGHANQKAGEPAVPSITPRRYDG